MSQICVTVCQTDIKWKDPKANAEVIETMMGDARPHLIVLPEMWNTGFVMAPADVAESVDNSWSLEWMRRYASSSGAAICGSMPMTVADGTIRNRCCFVCPDGETLHYDKHHLFAPGGEAEAYTPGNYHCVVDYRGMRFLLLVCYDLRFPLWSRYGRAGEYDAIIYIANWPSSRFDAWDVLTRARAIENQCYVIGANRVGTDPITSYLGWSRIVDYRGDILAECPTGKPSAVTASLDIDALRHARSRFAVLDDRD